MGSWLGYTVYPVHDVSLEHLKETLTEELDDTVMDVYHYDDPEWVTPRIIEEYDAVGARVSTSSSRTHRGDDIVVHTHGVEWATLREAVVEWLERCAESIEVAFIITLHDTSDGGVLCGYRSENSRLREIRSEDFEYWWDSKKDFESGARLHPYDHDKREVDRSVNYIVKFEEEFGYRPLTFYA